MKTSVGMLIGAAVAGLVCAPGALAQQTSVRDRAEQAGKVAGDIASQPAKDLNLEKKDIPPLLVEASQDPYRLPANVTCQQLASEVSQLNEVIGPDFAPAVAAAGEEDKSVKVAEAGGKAVYNSLVPFRGLVREVTGAAPAQRAMQQAVAAGLARRGFLRGVHRAHNCKTTF